MGLHWLIFWKKETPFKWWSALGLTPGMMLIKGCDVFRESAPITIKMKHSTGQMAPFFFCSFELVRLSDFLYRLDPALPCSMKENGVSSAHMFEHYNQECLVIIQLFIMRLMRSQCQWFKDRTEVFHAHQNWNLTNVNECVGVRMLILNGQCWLVKYE